MVEQAGFTDVTLSYASPSGDSRIAQAFSRLIGPLGQDLRLVHATKK